MNHQQHLAMRMVCYDTPFIKESIDIRPRKSTRIILDTKCAQDDKEEKKQRNRVF